jgi:hypothetical protein
MVQPAENPTKAPLKGILMPITVLAHRIWTRLFLLTGILLLASCAHVDPTVYRQEKPALDLKNYFNGTLTGHGMFQDRSGQVQRRFVVTIKASWNGDVGTLDEDFVWSDGKKEKRIWTLRKKSPNQYVGTASDVVGEALGIVEGNALNWQYTLRLPYKNDSIEVQFDDWMFLIDDRVMLNRAVMSKFGFRLGEVFISFSKTP